MMMTPEMPLIQVNTAVKDLPIEAEEANTAVKNLPIEAQTNLRKIELILNRHIWYLDIDFDWIIQFPHTHLKAAVQIPTT